MKIKSNSKIKRIRRVRSKIRGTKDRPRLSVFRSNKHIYAQIIDDDRKNTIVGISEKVLKTEKITQIEKATLLGEKIAQLANAKNIKQVIFDRGGYKYHGKIKALAEGARKGGLEF